MILLNVAVQLSMQYHLLLLFGQGLRLLPTFAGVLRKKIRTRAGSHKILTNYISEESLINGVYDKNIV